MERNVEHSANVFSIRRGCDKLLFAKASVNYFENYVRYLRQAIILTLDWKRTVLGPSFKS